MNLAKYLLPLALLSVATALYAHPGVGHIHPDEQGDFEVISIDEQT